jgi:glycosyltransferase involved in cell wall biosynthesis
MRILMVGTSYPRDSGDWRGIFLRHLAFALARQPGLELDLWVPPGEVPDTARYVADADETLWLRSLMDAGGISHLMRSGGLRALLAPVTLLDMLRRVYRRLETTELYHVNWLQCAIPLPADGKPLLLSVLGNDMSLLRLPLVTSLIRRSLKGRKAVICPNAEWMRKPLHDRFGDLAEVQPVAFGIDPAWYGIDRRIEAPAHWLVVTRLTRDKLGPLFEWSAPLFGAGGRELHLFGPMQEQIDVPAWVHYHGPVSAEQLAEKWFPAATGIITLSRHAEGRPQLMLEAMASGLPIIASDSPAHASLVRPGATGALCGSPGDYAEALSRLEDTETNRRVGNEARAIIRAEVGTWDDCARRYVDQYERLRRN